jgi:hypothetical protein
MFNFLDLDERVTAAAVAATGSIIGALIQLRVAWKKEVSERARGVPVTKKSRRGPVAAVVLLLVAAGVGGFAFSQSLVMKSERETAELRGELRTQLDQINATAARLELATLSDRQTSRSAADPRRGPDDVAVTATVGPCRARAAAGSDAATACTEQEAQRVTLCASVPTSVPAMDIALYARPEDSAQAWADSKVAPGQDLGKARFADKPFERAESDRTKQICTGFSAWDGEHAYSARLVVRYTAAPAPAPTPPTSEVTSTAVAPISAASH